MGKTFPPLLCWKDDYTLSRHTRISLNENTPLQVAAICQCQSRLFAKHRTVLHHIARSMHCELLYSRSLSDIDDFRVRDLGRLYLDRRKSARSFPYNSDLIHVICQIPDNNTEL